MQLAELDLVGFKSFAKKTNIVFHTGMTAIVGPNGCGKSNVVDAIRWVLGEQRSSALRSEKMENVIFAGSASAKPVGMAEVSLKIENTKNLLPLDYIEVFITRRLFRSGESQYFINGTQCRLRDIQDLFMDTGLSTNAYSVIELPQVERILNGKPDERRLIFEEAAGITKYKIRRKATFRKLEATEKDLIRVEDIISEVEKSVRSLHRQVAKAQRYHELSSELKTIEVNLATQEYSKILRELQPLTLKLAGLLQQREASAGDLAQKEAFYEQLRAKLLLMEKNLTEQQSIYNELTRELQKFEGRILVNQERIRSLKENVLRYNSEKESFVARLAELEQSQDQLTSDAQIAHAELDAERTRYQEISQLFNRIRSEYDAQRGRLREMESEILRITEELSRKQNEGERLRANEENLSQRLRQLTDDVGRHIERLQELSHEIADMQQRETRQSGQLQDTREQFGRIQKIIEEERHTLDGLLKADLQDQNRIELLENQAAMIRQLLESYQDYPAGVRFLATLEAEGFKSFGAVANVLKVPLEYRTAMSAALGEAATYLLVHNSAVAFNGIGLLKQDRKGVVSFLPLEDITSQKRERGLIPDLGIVGWAHELVQCDARFRPAIDALLDGLLVVQDLETAKRIKATTTSRQISLITLAGEVLGHWGLIRGGGYSKRQSDIIGRQEQLGELEQEIEQVKQAMQKRRFSMVRHEKEFQQKRGEVERLSAEMNKLEEELANTRVILGKLGFEETSLNEARQKCDLEKQRILGEVSQLGQNLQLQSEDATTLQHRRQQLIDHTAELSTQLLRMEQEVQSSSGKYQETQVNLAKVQGRYDALQKERDSVHAQGVEVQRMIDTRELEAVKADQEINELAEVNASYSDQIQDLRQKRQERETQLTALKEEQYQINVQTNEHEKLIRVGRAEYQQINESVHQAELRSSELKLVMENMRARLLEEFNHVLVAGEIDVTFQVAEAQSVIAELRDKIRGIGPVNLLALKEFEQEKERLDFLQTHREDLIKARQNLTDTIDILNNTAREKFMEIFEAIQKHFSQVFRIFFEGGRASLILTEGVDPLEADIEIYATPGGKKLSSLSLLSGGEKSLTAVSLLFAIYLVKPSPFCIFDEVDAPLDDVNVKRFSSALQEFSKNTQFIVVTHNKLTMRAANQLYGVTMEEEGISKVVSVKFGPDEDSRQPSPSIIAN